MKPLTEIAKDALELPPGERLTLVCMLLDVSEETHDFSPDAEPGREEENCWRMGL